MMVHIIDGLPPISSISPRPLIHKDRISICFSTIDETDRALDDLYLLDQRERERAKQFITPRLKNRFVSSHSFLRKCLARVINQLASKIEIHIDDYGKPFLDPKLYDLHFSLSHSGQTVMVGLSWKGPIGVDVERVSTDTSLLEIANHHFSEYEQRALNSLPLSKKMDFFFRLWVAKEAYTKSVGKGLSLDLKTVDFFLSSQNEVEKYVCHNNFYFYDLSSFCHLDERAAVIQSTMRP